MLVLFSLALVVVAAAIVRQSIRPINGGCELCFVCRCVGEVAPSRVDELVVSLFGPAR